MAGELFRRGLLDRTRALAGWCVGVALYILLLAAVFPSLRDATDLNELVDKYPEGLKELFGLSAGIDLTTGAGYLDAELFSFMLPLFALVLAIGSGARVLAGEEEAGRLELLFAYPIRRRDGVLAKGATVAVEVALFATAVAAAMLLFDPLFDLGLSAGRVAGAAASVGVLALLHGWIALAVAGFTPSRALATAVPAALAAAGYLIAALHDLAGWLDPLRFLSAFWWVGRAPLREGASPGGMLVVAAAAVAALGAAAYLIDRRDLKTP
jgi:ABC-2 type transport system permease protein